MLDDINDEPAIIKTLLDEYLSGTKIKNIDIAINSISKIYIIASGSSRNAGNVAKSFIESSAQIPVIVEHASEFAVRNPVLSKDDLVIFVSQSGETADVLAALQTAKNKGSFTFAVTNNPESTIHNTADEAMFIYAGKETSIPATKSFIAQLVCLYIIGIYLGEKFNLISSETITEYKKIISEMPEKIAKIISNTEETDKIAEKLFAAKSLIILGKGQNFGLAEEAALKIQETCYINAASYPTGEFLHGHLALVDESCPVISIITKYEHDNHVISTGNTIKLIKKREAEVFIVKDESDDYVTQKLSDYNTEFLNITEDGKDFSSVYTAVVLHLLAYKMAVRLGHDVNNPRSLSKTVSND